MTRRDGAIVVSTRLSVLLIAAAAAAAAALAATIACTDDKPECYAGEYTGCSCANGASGYARCDAKEKYGACVCDGTTPGIDASTPPKTGAGDGGNRRDGGGDNDDGGGDDASDGGDGGP